MDEISIEAFKEAIAAQKNNPSADFINVCTPAEYAAEHIGGVRNVPLDELPDRAEEFKGKQVIYVHCRGGSRSQRAIDTLRNMGVDADLVRVPGGIAGWRKAGFKTASKKKEGRKHGRAPKSVQ